MGIFYYKNDEGHIRENLMNVACFLVLQRSEDCVVSIPPPFPEILEARGTTVRALEHQHAGDPVKKL